MDLWAAYCHREGLSFEDFSTGMDIAMMDQERWNERGFALLRDKVREAAQSSQ